MTFQTINSVISNSKFEKSKVYTIRMQIRELENLSLWQNLSFFRKKGRGCGFFSTKTSKKGLFLFFNILLRQKQIGHRSANARGGGGKGHLQGI